MGAAVNGMAAHGGIIPFGSTFLIFSDYLRPSMRLAALMELGVIYVFTHDSIGVGEDGPTHQPIEQLAALRAIPRLVVIRPGDANETARSMERCDREPQPSGRVGTVAAERADPRSKPSILRQPAFAGAPTSWPMPPEGRPDMVLIGTGSELSLVVAAREKLLEQKINARVVSMPSWELFDDQPQDYRESVLPPDPRAARCRSGVAAGLASLRRRRRRRHRCRALWRVGSGQYRAWRNSASPSITSSSAPAR